MLAHHRWDLQIAVQDALNQAEGRGDVYQEEQRDVSTDSDQEYAHCYNYITKTVGASSRFHVKTFRSVTAF